MLSKPTAFPICTIANTPRLPEHCIEWASVLEWPRVHGDKKMDTDDPAHIDWLYKTALNRAQEFKIEGVTWSLTQGVVKNIIPAIASTNAIIAASCCNEAFKIASGAAERLDSYMMVTGTEGVYTHTFKHDRKDDCPVCGDKERDITIPREWTLENVIEMLLERQDLQIKKPSISYGPKPLYLQGPPQLEASTRPNLAKKLSELVADGDVLSVTSTSLPFGLELKITYK